MNSGGRPRHYAGELKKTAISLRTTPAIHDALKRAAESNGRSITQEVEARLLVSLEHDSGKRSAETGRLLNDLGAELAKIEEMTGRAWHRCRRTAGALLEMLSTYPSQLIKVDEPGADEAVSKKFDVWFELCTKRKGLLSDLERLGVPIDAGASGWLDVYIDGGTAGRWRERQALAGLNLPDEINRASLRLVAQIEELDTLIKAAKSEMEEASAPFDEAERAGREMYRKELKRRSVLAFARMQQLVRSIDVNEISRGL